MQGQELVHFDRQHLWHPYTAFGNDDPLFPVATAQACRLTLTDGRQLIDGMASWWCAIHGYNHPVLNQALKDQVDNMSHVMFGGLTHEPAVELAKTLVKITPEPLQAIFYTDSGSVSVEAALKMAVQYQQARHLKERTRFITVCGGYHGDTTGAMSVSDPENGMHSMFSNILNHQIHAPGPICRFRDNWDKSDFTVMASLIESHQHEIAAVIIEPIMQGAGGMWFYHPEYLRHLRAICDEYELLLIFDEIATGFGRTGKMFAMEHADVTPDILCIGKALTGGTMTMASIMTTYDVAYTINQSDAGIFMHGPTFMANPLACAAANASLKLLQASDWQANVKHIETIIQEKLEPAREAPAVIDVRSLGATGVVETCKPVNQAKLCAAFVDTGVWIRPFNRFIYIMPAYVISTDELIKLCASMVDIVTNLERYT